MKKQKNENSDHVTDIAEYIQVIVHTDDIHALIVEGPPGWGKTTAVEKALRSVGLESAHLGAYSTPLNLYHFLLENSSEIVLLDDCSGLFNDSTAMAILKAATWPNQDNRRVIKWGSSSGKVLEPEFDFLGKLIIVCNYFPSSPDGEAIRSRGYVRKIDVSVDDAKDMLIQGAQEKKYFPNTTLACEVADFLIQRLSNASLPQMSFRTLKKGYHLAEVHPHSWQKLFSHTLPPEIPLKPEDIVKELANRNIKVREQLNIFMEKTGLKERSFYNYRKDLKIRWKTK